MMSKTDSAHKKKCLIACFLVFMSILFLIQRRYAGVSILINLSEDHSLRDVLNLFLRGNMTIKAILFDHDGTLVNSEFTHFYIWQQVLRSYGVNFTEEQYKADHSGIPTPKNAEIFIDRFNLSDSAVSLIAQKEAGTREYLLRNQYPLMPLVIDVIKLIENYHLKMAVVTGAGGESARCTLKSYDLEKYFVCVVSGDDVLHSKPAGDVYLHAVEKLKLLPSQCIALEDTATGVKSAHAAGIICCAIPNVFSNHHDFTLANFIASDISEAFRWIESNFLLGE